MNFYTKTVVLLLLFTLASTIHKDMVTRLQRCTSKCNKEYCNVTSVCRSLNRTLKLYSLDNNFHPGVIVEAPINIEVNAYKKFTTVYRPFMIKVKEDFCTVVIQKDHIFYKLAGETEFTTMGNMFDPCPFQGRRYVPRQRTDENLYFLFPLLPVGDWRFDIVFSKTINGSDVFIVSGSMFYEIKPTGAAQF